MNLKGRGEELYGKVWMKESEGRNIVIKIQYQKNKPKKKSEHKLSTKTKGTNRKGTRAKGECLEQGCST